MGQPGPEGWAVGTITRHTQIPFRLHTRHIGFFTFVTQTHTIYLPWSISFISGLSRVLSKWPVEPLTLAAKPTAGITHTLTSSVSSGGALYLDTFCVCARMCMHVCRRMWREGFRYRWPSLNINHRVKGSGCHPLQPTLKQLAPSCSATVCVCTCMYMCVCILTGLIAVKWSQMKFRKLYFSTKYV